MKLIERQHFVISIKKKFQISEIAVEQNLKKRRKHNVVLSASSGIERFEKRTPARPVSTCKMEADSTVIYIFRMHT